MSTAYTRDVTSSSAIAEIMLQVGQFCPKVEYDILQTIYRVGQKNWTIFTALHAMQTRSSDEISVCPSVCLSVCLSVYQTRAL